MTITKKVQSRSGPGLTLRSTKFLPGPSTCYLGPGPPHVWPDPGLDYGQSSKVIAVRGHSTLSDISSDISPSSNVSSNISLSPLYIPPHCR